MKKVLILFVAATFTLGYTSCKKCETCSATTETFDLSGASTGTSETSLGEYCGDDLDDLKALYPQEVEVNGVKASAVTLDCGK